MSKFRNFWNLKEFLKRIHYSSYFEGLFIKWKNCLERKKHNISFFSFQRSWNGWIKVRLYFVRYFFTSALFFKINYFFSREKTNRYYSRLFPDWAVRLQNITEDRYQLSILQKVKFPQPKYLFCKTRKFDLLFYFLRFFKGLPSWGYYGDNIFFLRSATLCRETTNKELLVAACKS